MVYMKEESNREIVLIRYYSVLFYLMFMVRLDEYKKNLLVDRINSGENMMMKDIYGWCQKQRIPVTTKFFIEKTFQS